MLIFFLPISLYLAAVGIYFCQDKYLYYKYWGYYAVLMVLVMIVTGVNLWGVFLIINN